MMVSGKSVIIHWAACRNERKSEPLSFKSLRTAFCILLTSSLLASCVQLGGEFDDERSASPISAYRDSMGDSIWCVPGCKLPKNDVGETVVPNWCSAWGGATDFKLLNSSGTADDQAFLGRHTKNQFKADRCYRIELDQEAVEAAGRRTDAIRVYDFRTNSFPNGGETVTCEPGCIIPWDKHGNSHSGANAEIAPIWCATWFDGCHNNGKISGLPVCRQTTDRASACSSFFVDQLKQ